jgi:hypothetical protein
VLKVDADKAKNWSDKDVLIQWHKGFKGTLLTHKFVKGEDLNEFELMTVNDSITQYRQRLIDISWFMRSLSEPIARMANKEDKCTGRFWEGRFKSQALLDEAAVLACMAYVDYSLFNRKSYPRQNGHHTRKLRLYQYSASNKFSDKR